MGKFCDSCKKNESDKRSIYKSSTISYSTAMWKGDTCEKCRGKLIKDLGALANKYNFEQTAEATDFNEP